MNNKKQHGSATTTTTNHNEVVVDYLCECGHPHISHAALMCFTESEAYAEAGMGCCLFSDCECDEFTPEEPLIRGSKKYEKFRYLYED